MIFAGTGHRPPRLGLTYLPFDRNRLRDFVELSLVELPNVCHVLSGGAQGFDQALAEAAMSLGIPVTMVLPFEGMERMWPFPAIDHFRMLLANATKVEIISKKRHKAVFLLRDRRLVDHADSVVTLFDGDPKGGTAYTVRYAERQGKALTNLWDDWRRFREKS